MLSNAPWITGSPFQRKVTTGRLYAAFPGLAGLFDLGNVDKFNQANDHREVEHLGSVNGVVVRDEARVSVLNYGYDFTLSEFPDMVQQILQQNASPTNKATAAAVTAASATVSSVVLGRSYQLPYNLANVTVAVSAVNKTLGTDYLLDAVNGVLTVIPGGGIAAAANLTITYDAGAYTQVTFNSGTDATFYGTFTFYENDQLSGGPRNVHTWSGTITIPKGAGESDGQKYRTVDAHCVCWTRPVVQDRRLA